MDAASLAASAVALLVSYLLKGAEEFAKEMGKATAEKTKSLLQTLKDSFKKDKDEKGEQTLSLFEGDPHVFKEALTRMLAEKLRADPGFVVELASLVGEAKPSEAKYQVEFHGETKIKGFVQGERPQVIQVFEEKSE